MAPFFWLRTSGLKRVRPRFLWLGNGKGWWLQSSGLSGGIEAHHFAHNHIRLYAHEDFLIVFLRPVLSKHLTDMHLDLDGLLNTAYRQIVFEPPLRLTREPILVEFLYASLAVACVANLDDLVASPQFGNVYGVKRVGIRRGVVWFQGEGVALCQQLYPPLDSRVTRHHHVQRPAFFADDLQ